jgi:hypothetical protein
MASNDWMIVNLKGCCRTWLSIIEDSALALPRGNDRNLDIPDLG